MNYIAKLFYVFSCVLMLLSIIFFLTLFIVFKNSGSNYEYSEFIKARMLLSCGTALGLELLFLIFGIIFFKKTGFDVIQRWMLIVWFVYIIVILGYGLLELGKHYQDITNGDYITYVGEFEKDHTREFVFLDKRAVRLINTNSTFLNQGKYSGEIIYSKRTKYVLKVSLNTGFNVSVMD